MKSRKSILSLVLLFVASASIEAAPLNGSFGFTGLNATKNGTDLSNTTLFTFTDFLVTSNGSVDYSGVTTGTFFSGPNPPTVTGILDITSPVTMAGFSITNPNFGTFVASNSAFNQIISQSANFIDLQLVGVFTPAGTLAGFSATPSDIRASFNFSGSSISAAFTLTSPTSVPEPSTYALGALGTVVLGTVARRKRQARASS